MIDQQKNHSNTLLESIYAEFMFVTSIKKISFYVANLFCDKAYKKKMVKSHSRLTKELDLRKFMHRQRVFTTAAIGLLSGPQSLFVNKMSQLIIRESSASETSGDDELNDKQKSDLQYVRKMIHSRNRVDKRFLKFY